MASAMTSSASPYISAVSMWVMPRSSPRRNAATAAFRSPRSRYQVPCPMTETSWPVEPNFLFFMRFLARLLPNEAVYYRGLRYLSAPLRARRGNPVLSVWMCFGLLPLACRNQLAFVIGSRLRDQALEFGNARAAIGTRLQLEADFRRRA